MQRFFTILSFAFLLLLHNKTEAQQDIHFTQFYELPLLRNPALAGIFNGKVRLTAAYRNQWQSITVPYQTTAIGIEAKKMRGLAEGDAMTFGFQFTHDVAGDSKLSRTQFLPVLNYHKSLNSENTTLLSLAFMGGLVSERFDPSQLKFDDQFVNGSYNTSNVTSQTFTRTAFGYVDASVGLSLTSTITDNSKFYIGASLFHFNSPSLTFMKDKSINLNKKLGFNAGYIHKTNTDGKIVVYADHFRQGPNRITQLGMLYSHDFDPTMEYNKLSLSAGVIFRLNDAIVPVVKINKNNWGLGFSYDTNVSSLRTASNFRGGFEMTLSVLDLWNRENPDTEKTKCAYSVW